MYKFLIICFSALTAGCATYTGGYMPYVPSRVEIPNISQQKKRDVSFSISYYQQVGDDIIISEKSIQKEIKTQFEDSHLFRSIYNIPLDNKTNYHYHFDIKLTGTSPADQQAMGLAAGYTLLVFPVWMNFYIDTTMYLFVDNREVFSSTVSEKVTDLVWLPLAWAWPFMNHGTVGSSLKKKILKYFTNEIVQNKLYEYPMADDGESSQSEYSYLYE